MTDDPTQDSIPVADPAQAPTKMPTNTPTNAPTNAPIQTPRATSYSWRLMMLIPAILLAGYGYWRYIDVPKGGEVTSIRISSKPDIAGQVRDAYAGIAPTTSDLYLMVAKAKGDPLRLKTYVSTPLGNGLTWPLEPSMTLGEIARVEVWDHNAILKDKELDRIELARDEWSADGQTFHVAMIGTHDKPPRWALPLASVGAVLGAVVLLRFVWDQAL